VTSDGLAITNYHVVSQVALEPKTYRLEDTAADGSHGDVTVLGLNLPNDLAIIRLDKHDAPFFTFDERALAGDLLKGEPSIRWAIPLDLGFTITKAPITVLWSTATANASTSPGALNYGVSGGPAEGRVVGINVATRRGGQLISFLVLVRFAAAVAPISFATC